MTYWPWKALPSTISWSGVTASAEKTSSSTIGPAGDERIFGKTWSFSLLRWKTTVVSSTASVLSRLYSSEDGPFSSAIASWRSNVNLTSDAVRSLPLAHFRPGFSFTVYSVGAVNSADSAMSGSTSGLPYGVFIRNGNTWFITANEPLSYEPAGSIVVILSLVPMVSASPPPPPPEPPPSSPPPPHAARASAVTARPAVATRAPRPPVETELIRLPSLLPEDPPARRTERASHRAVGVDHPWVARALRVPDGPEATVIRS